MDTLAFGCKFPTIRALYGLSPIRLRPCRANQENHHRSDFRTVVFGLYPIQFYFSVKDITLSQGFPSSKTVHRTVFEFTSCGALVQECFAVCGRRLRGTFMRKSPLEPRKRTGKLPVPTLNAETIIQTVRVVLLTERFGCCIHVLTIAAVRQ